MVKVVWPRGVDLQKLLECNCEYCQAVVEKYLRGSRPDGQVTLDAIAADGGEQV
jgi:hypothetical protein